MGSRMGAGETECGRDCALPSGDPKSEQNLTSELRGECSDNCISFCQRLFSLGIRRGLERNTEVWLK